MPKTWWFEALLALLAAASLVIFNDIRANVHEGRKAMEELNTKVAIVIERQIYQDRRIDTVEKRVDRLDNSPRERKE